MKSQKIQNIWNVSLPWSDGLLSARAWQNGSNTVVSVPELDILCTGQSQSEAVFRLFSLLLKYYQELKDKPFPLSDRDARHFDLLSEWVFVVEKKMTGDKQLIPTA